MPDGRECPVCLEVKSPEEFREHRQQCWDCIRERQRRYYAEHKEQQRARSRAYYLRRSTRPRREQPWGYRRPGAETYPCTRCGLVKDASHFTLTHSGRAVRSHCKECRTKDSRWQSVARRYGLSRLQYAELFASQGGTCAICRKPPPVDRQFSVDHDHRCCPGQLTCGKCVRGLLCVTCNHLLGMATDNPEILLAAAVYLDRSSG